MALRGEIICVGDELLSGRVSDENSSFLASRLWPLGILLSRVSFIGDEPPVIRECLVRSLDRSDFVIVTGGLGTTDDDLTSRAAAEVFGLPLTESPRMVHNLRICLEPMGREVTAEIRKMAQIPEGAEILSQRSAGYSLSDKRGKPVFFLPGVPEEMRRLAEKKVIPELLQMVTGGGVVATRELGLYGLPESEVGARLKGLIQGREGVRLGFYPEFPEVRVVVTARGPEYAPAAALAQELIEEAGRRLGSFVFSLRGESLEEVVVCGLGGRGLNLSLAESCTGGLIGHRITQASGSSSVLERGLVAYSNQAKQDLLGVRAETLQAHGAVSQETAREMARGAAARSGTDLGLAVTGIAGPKGGSKEKPVGTVWFALASEDGCRAGIRRFFGGRKKIKAQAAETALDWLRRFVEDDTFLHCP